MSEAGGISPELAQKALRIEAGNALKKIQSGKTLTSAERALIQAIAEGDNPAEAKGFVTTKVDLSNALGVSRKTIDRWQHLRRNGPPAPEADGRWNVVEWKRWMKETGRGGGVDGDTLDDELPRLNAKRILLINERLELDNAERRGELISREEVVKEAAEIATTLRSALYGQGASICSEVVKLNDLDEAVKVYTDAVDRVLHGISQGLKTAKKKRSALETEDRGADDEDADDGLAE